MNRNRVTVLSLMVSLTFATAAAAGTVASAAKKGSAVAFAHVAGGGVVTAFGGKGTASVATSNCFVDGCSVTFTGKYPDDIATGNVIAVVGSDSGNYGVVNYVVQAATPTSIQVSVATFASNTTSPTGNGFHVAIFIGKAP